MIDAHADVVGSLLRPPELIQARNDLAAGRLAPAAFKEIEDGAVDWAIRLQEDAGLDVVTDGEMRRLSFQSQMTEAVEGFGAWDLTPSSGASGTGSKGPRTGSANARRTWGWSASSNASAPSRSRSSFTCVPAPMARPR
jgi:methionine synthase II (cobalamin-independent)